MDPEALYAELMSGDVGTLRALALDLYKDAETVDGAADRIAHGTMVPIWSGGQAMLYRMVGQNTYVAAAGTAWHVARTADFLDATADHYGQVRKAARMLIRFWREWRTTLDADQAEALAARVYLNLWVVARNYSNWLIAAGTSLHRDGGDEFEEWLEHGFRKDYTFKGLTGAWSGPRVPDSLTTGEDYVPQGLAYHEGKTYHTSYAHTDSGHDDSRLTIVDHETGRQLTEVQLGGVRNPGDDHEGHPPHHSGGVATDGKRVWVVSTEGDKSYVYVYSQKDIDAANGGEVQALSKQEVPASSYVTYRNGSLYFGKYSKPGKDDDGYHGEDKGALYQVDPRTFETTEVYQTPEGVNGVIVQDDSFVFAVNKGRYEEGQLVTYGHEDGATKVADGPLSELDVGNLPEEIVLTDDGKILVNTESGADRYSPFSRQADHVDDDKQTNLDRLDELWAQTRLAEIDLDAVTDGYQVEPPTLDEAAREFAIASDLLDDAATDIAGTTLAASVLGTVDGAPVFANQVNIYLDQAAEHIALGSGGTGTTSQGLINQMRTYEDTDSAVLQALTPFEALGLTGPLLPEAPPG